MKHTYEATIMKQTKPKWEYVGRTDYSPFKMDYTAAVYRCQYPGLEKYKAGGRTRYMLNDKVMPSLGAALETFHCCPTCGKRPGAARPHTGGGYPNPSALFDDGDDYHYREEDYAREQASYEYRKLHARYQT